MSQPALVMRMPLWEFVARCRADFLRDSLYHVVDDLGGGKGLEHFGYAFADKAAADAYHAGLPAFISSQAIDASNSRVIRSTDPAYAAGFTDGESVAPASVWSPKWKGADVLITAAGLNANVTGLEEWVRCQRGRDPADGGVYQWEITVPGGAGSNNQRPGFGMIDERNDTTITTRDMGSDAYSWGFRTAPPGDGTPSYVFHSGNAGDTWAGFIGGTAFTVQLVWDAVNKTLKIYIGGLLQYTLSVASPGSTGAPVGTDGFLMFPAFCSYSNAAPGAMTDNGLANFAGPFLFPIPGAVAWAS